MNIGGAAFAFDYDRAADVRSSRGIRRIRDTNPLATEICFHGHVVFQLTGAGECR